MNRPTRAAVLPRRKDRGFILIIILGMLAVLAILGLSFAEQGRVDLLGARNTVDVAAADRLAETGFEMALRVLADDRHVPSADNAAWNANLGPGWTSRWAYNPAVGAGTAAGGSQSADAGPGKTDPRMSCESWQSIFWSEEDQGTNAAYGYNFTFDLTNAVTQANTTVAQRHPVDDKVLMDNWPRQPVMGVKRFRARFGNSYGRIQIAVFPRDGGPNLNDVFEAGTITEYPGIYERLETASTDPNIKYASPDRRTMEYLLGKRPEWANRGPEMRAIETSTYTLDINITQPYANQPAGNLLQDDGVYNFRRAFEPNGMNADPGVFYRTRGFLTTSPANKPTVFFNAGATQPNRYNFEGARYPLWASATGTSLGWDEGGIGDLATLNGSNWWPAGRFRAGPIINGNPYSGSSYAQGGEVEMLFNGFGFDMLNPRRGGVGAASGYGDDSAECAPFVWGTYAATDPLGETKYIGAGIYGMSKPQSFQRHYMAYALNGRFWSDLHANWYFGGAPGYTQSLGASMESTSKGQNWMHLGSTYDSCGMGSNWMPPIAHMWKAGSGNWTYGRISTRDTNRGLQRDPGNMPPVKPAATFAYPLKKWGDDYGLANAQWLFNDVRGMLRASGVQENWGLWGADDARGRFYDAVNINICNFQVAYGLLTPEKIPSMMQRTVVAPHLHWKARLLDAAYVNHDQFGRYNPNAATGPNPFPPLPYHPWDDLFYDLAPVDNKADDVLPAAGADGVEDRKDSNLPFGDYNPDTGVFRYFHADPAADGNTAAADGRIWPTVNAGVYTDVMGPTYFKWSIHRAYLDRSTPAANDYLKPLDAPATVGEADRVILGKMDFVTPEPLEFKDETGATIRHGSGQPADDVFTGVNYDLSLYDPASFNAAATGAALAGSAAVCRPMRLDNWADWFLQRKSAIPESYDEMPRRKPNSNKLAGMSFPEGKVPAVGAQLAGAVATSISRQDTPTFKPHPVWGVPNPDYLLLYPGSEVSAYWADQSRRYFPVYGGLGGHGPSGIRRMLDTYESAPSKQREWVRPYAPVPKSVQGVPAAIDPFVPAIGRDEAWRITRVGRKYQEIIADELMDYQINPHWPNPCIHGLIDIGETAVPLTKTAFVSPTRQNAKSTAPTSPKWRALEEYKAKAGIEYEVPDYWAYFNRFWVRGGGKYTGANRGWAESYRPSKTDPQLPNPVENPGIYPQSFQYFGQLPTPNEKFADWIMDFPYNTLEDQSGSEWRYVSGTIKVMLEPRGRTAPARNHPFRNWADFVAFLGHLVYRSPIHVSATNDGSDGRRHRRYGVKARAVKGMPAGGTFFDGSSIDDGDSLKEPTVARAGFWPISANYGEWAQTSDGYPPAAGPWAGDADEWRRRMDEWRGRDAAGLRVEHNYISEAAANDVLVSFSNGRVKPIDFNGDGHITMTRKDEIPDVDKFWPGFPWHAPGEGNITNVEHRGNPVTGKLDTTPHGDEIWKNAGSDLAQSTGWAPTSRDQIIQGCVTLPIKFRSNTFRIAVLVELTDPTYTNVYAVRRYNRVVSRIPGTPGAGQVHGDYTGEFYQHSSRVMTGVDPEMSFLGTK